MMKVDLQYFSFSGGWQGYSDDRLKGTNELLQGIKLIKLNGWEERFRSRIKTSRDSEIKALYKVAALTSSMCNV